MTERLYWITCKDVNEANYLLAIINSDALYEAAQPLMSKGQFGSRDLHKHLWKLPIPEFDPKQKLHVAIAKAGERAATGAAQKLAEVREERGDKFSVTIARRELRKWLRESNEGKEVEAAVGQLLGLSLSPIAADDAETERREAWLDFLRECRRNPIYLDPDIDINDLIDEMYESLLEPYGLTEEVDVLPEVTN